MKSKKKQSTKKKKPVNLEEYRKTKEFVSDIKTGKLYDDLKKKTVKMENPYHEFFTDGKFDSNKFLKKGIALFLQLQALKILEKKNN